MTNDIAAPRAKALTRAGGLPNLESQLRVEAMLFEFKDINWINHVQPVSCGAFLARVPRELQRTRDQIAAAPSAKLLIDFLEEVNYALVAPPDEKVTAAAVALLFDSRARQPANPVIYLAALCNDLVRLRFQPAVVAGACQRLRETSQFIPEICEVIEACRKVQAHYSSTARLAGKALETRQEILLAIKEAESLPAPAPPLAQQESRDWNPDA